MPLHGYHVRKAGAATVARIARIVPGAAGWTARHGLLNKEKQLREFDRQGVNARLVSLLNRPPEFSA